MSEIPFSDTTPWHHESRSPVEATATQPPEGETPAISQTQLEEGQKHVTSVPDAIDEEPDELVHAPLASEYTHPSHLESDARQEAYEPAPETTRLRENSGETKEAADRVAALQDLFTPSDAVVAECRPKLWEAADQLGATIINPDQREAIATYAGIFDWGFFGEPGSPLPEGLIIKVDKEGQQTIDLQAHGYLNSGLGIVHGELKKAGLGEVTDKVAKELEERSPEIRSAVSDLISQTPAYRLLASFDMPQSHLKEQPLTHFWRTVKSQHIEESVRAKFGNLDSEAAQRELSEQIYCLDQETMPLNKKQSQEDALRRAREYLRPHVAHAFESDTANDGGFGGIYRHDGLTFIRAKGESGDRDLSSYSPVAAESIRKLVPNDIANTQFMSDKLFRSAIEVIMNPETTGAFSQVLDQVMRETSEDVTDTLTTAIVEPARYVHSGFTTTASNEASFLLRQPAGEIVPDQPINSLEASALDWDYNWREVFQCHSSLVTREEIWRSANIFIGEVQQYEPGNFRTGMRLIQSQAAKEVPGSDAQREDMVLAFERPYAWGKQPFVPGYRLVSESQTKDRYGFVVDPNGDPYAACDIVVEQDRARELAATYQSIGLHDLAEKVSANPDLTVEQLVKFIRQSSTYYIPDKVEYTQAALNANWRQVDSLESFTNSVRENKLYIQCTGAASFLKHSLEKVFGAECAGVAEGYTISGASSVIDALKHLQVVFTNDGRQYILDATPARADIGLPGALPASSSTKKHTSAHAPHLVPEQRTKKPAAATAREVPKSEQVATLLTSVVEQLKAALDARTNEALYAHIVALPDHDPARRTLELLLQAKGSDVSQDDIAWRLSYLGNCVQADQKTRKRLKFEHYSTTFLEQLRYAVSRLDTILDR